MKINGYCLYIKEQRHFDGDFEEAFNGNLLTEKMTIEIIREHMKKGNPLKIICGANVIVHKESENKKSHKKIELEPPILDASCIPWNK